MQYFYKFFGTDNHIANGEMFVRCPFPHTDPYSGEEYYETRPSAHINIEKSTFHCKVCNEGHSEVSFFAKIHGVTYRQALELIESTSHVNDRWTELEEMLEKSSKPKELIREFGWENVYKKLRLGYEGAGISFPVFLDGVLMGSCRYIPDGEPKAKLSPGLKNLIYPYDLWDKDKPTLLTAGFKDCTTAIAYGFNAITFTHGEGSVPKLFKPSFKGKTVYIAYDNDVAGKQGAIKAAIFIKEAGGLPYIVDLSSVCAEQGEDIHDFFKKYKKSAKDLQELIDQATLFDDETYEVERNKEYPLVGLANATKGKYHNRLVSSRVSVIARWEVASQVPEYVEFEKVYEGKNDLMPVGSKAIFALDEDNLKDVLYLMENEDKMNQNLRKLAGVPLKEQGVVMRIKSYINIFKAVVADDISTSDVEYDPFELTVYRMGEPFKYGEKARIFYRPVPHPLKEQVVVGIVSRVEDSDSSVTNFKVTEEVIEDLKLFQVQEGETVKDKMNEFAERAKAIAGVETLPQLAWTTDLFYHTPLYFQWYDRIERAYLDIMIIGESRTGKSQTAKKLMDLYELGMFTSLKGATIAGLIGGSDQTSGGYTTKLGVLPRNHLGAVIMEEFSGASRELIGKLTDIRSSNMVRLDRVNGSTRAPAMVRMLSISNQRKNSQGESIPLRQHASGVEVVINLVGTAEDIGRYDFFILIDKPEHYTSPNERVTIEAFPKRAYMNRVRWVWSRTKEQIIIDDHVKDLIVHYAERLNKKFDCHINFFGPEAWKKLTRVSIAVAGMCASTDATFENLVVKEEHVTWAKNFLVACYDNELFNLPSYVENERRYTACPDTSVATLQGIYRTNANVLHQLAKGTEFPQRQLQALSGLKNDDFNRLISLLAECYFIRYSRTGDRIIPTERFRKAFRQINTKDTMKRVGSVF